MSPLPEFDPDVFDDEQRAVLETVTAGRGRLPTPYRVWIASPELARRLHPLGQFLSGGTGLDKAEAEIAVLAAARRWGGDYVVAVHAREAAEAGLDGAVIADLRAGREPHPSDERQAAVATMMTALAGDGAVDQETVEAVTAVLGAAGIAEVLALAGYFTAVALAMRFYDVAVPGAPAS